MFWGFPSVRPAQDGQSAFRQSRHSGREQVRSDKTDESSAAPMFSTVIPTFRALFTLLQINGLADLSE